MHTLHYRRVLFVRISVQIQEQKSDRFDALIKYWHIRSKWLVWQRISIRVHNSVDRHSGRTEQEATRRIRQRQIHSIYGGLFFQEKKNCWSYMKKFLFCVHPQFHMHAHFIS